MSHILNKKLILYFILGATLLLISTMRIPAALAQVVGWSIPHRLGPGWFPDILADQTGRVHVVWASRSDQIAPQREATQIAAADEADEPFRGYDVVMYTTLLEGSQVDPALDVAALRQTGGTEATRPSLLVDPRGYLHLSFRDTAVYYSHALADKAAAADQWLRYIPVSTGHVAYFSDMAVDKQGKLHLVYTQNMPTGDCAICYHVYYRWSTDNGLNWSPPVDISRIPTGAAKPQILLDRDEQIHVVWEAGRGGSYGRLEDGPMEVMYSVSRDGGESWMRPQRLSALDTESKNVALAQDGDGKLVVVWLSLPDDRIFYRVSINEGRSWSNFRVIENLWSGWGVYNTNLDQYTMVPDAAGRVHLIMVGRLSEEEENLRVLHLVWDDDTWSEPESIVQLRGDVPEWPRATLANGNELYVTWFVRDEENIWLSESGRYEVWYAWRTIDAPRIAPSPWSTVTPTPTPGLGRASLGRDAVTATPDPALLAVPLAGGSVYSENDETQLIGLSLLPALFLAGGIIVAWWLRRH